jgi:hypothetical protein
MCNIEGCQGPVVARGLCAKHYKRQQRTGDPNKTRRPGPQTSEQRKLIDHTFKDWSPRTRGRYVQALSLLAPCGQEVMREAITAATRSNGSINVCRLVEIAAMARAMFEDRGEDQG